ncbi:MAG: class B sortase [Bacteroidales bacterium]|nr:class B sortase [Clostridium sp.]MCM1203085.1 class B sortase [Bacteroidales bacterium]
MKKKKIINLLIILCMVTALGCGGYLAYYYYTSRKSEGEVADLRQQIIKTEQDISGSPAEEPVEVDGVMVQKKFEKLYRQNHDFIGWLKIEDTDVDYPVMHTPHDTELGEYYIHRDFEQQYSAAGLPFVDANCELQYPTDNIIVYGHNMNSGKMFHDILNYGDKEFYEGHKSFTFDTIYGDGEYEVVAMFYGQILPEASTDFKYYQFVNAGTEEEFMDFVNNIKRMSIIDTGVEVQYGDKLVTLSTCAYHVKDGRFAVVGRKK